MSTVGVSIHLQALMPASVYLVGCVIGTEVGQLPCSLRMKNAIDVAGSW